MRTRLPCAMRRSMRRLDGGTCTCSMTYARAVRPMGDATAARGRCSCAAAAIRVSRRRNRSGAMALQARFFECPPGDVRGTTRGGAGYARHSVTHGETAQALDTRKSPTPRASRKRARCGTWSAGQTTQSANRCLPSFALFERKLKHFARAASTRVAAGRDEEPTPGTYMSFERGERSL